jgi:hypothetical protein
MNTTPRTPPPRTADQLAEIQARASSRSTALTAWLDKFSPLVEGQSEVERAETVLSEDVPALLVEVGRLRAEITAAVDRLRDMQRLEPNHARAAALHGVEMQLRYAIDTETEASR